MIFTHGCSLCWNCYSCAGVGQCTTCLADTFLSGSKTCSGLFCYHLLLMLFDRCRSLCRWKSHAPTTTQPHAFVCVTFFSVFTRISAADCTANCTACVGSGATQCTSCVANYYLDTICSGNSVSWVFASCSFVVVSRLFVFQLVRRFLHLQLAALPSACVCIPGYFGASGGTCRRTLLLLSFPVQLVLI